MQGSTVSTCDSRGCGLWRDAKTAFQWETPLPRFRRVKQLFPHPVVHDVGAAVFDAMDSADGAARLGGGKRVAVTAGSRGIARIPEILAAVVQQVRRYGGDPVLVPAMGSHGGATAEGQRELLAELGITEEVVGAPIEATMDVVQLGETSSGLPIYMDRIATAADAIVVVNRVKPHTDFRGPWESGLAKMIVIGLGNRRGAETIHRYGTEGLRDMMPEVARLAVERAPIAMGIAVVENAYDEVASVTGVPPSGIAGPEEAALLVEARDFMPGIPFEDIDVLIVEEMGKNISGAGMDPNVLGRMGIFGMPDPTRPRIRSVAVLDITGESHGNATGIGLADVTTRQLIDKVNFEAFYVNGLTSGTGATRRLSLPVVAPDDRSAVMTAVRVCGRPDSRSARVVRIKNTLKLDEMDVSEALWPETLALGRVSSLGDPFPLEFDSTARLRRFETTL